MTAPRTRSPSERNGVQSNQPRLPVDRRRRLLQKSHVLPSFSGRRHDGGPSDCSLVQLANPAAAAAAAVVFIAFTVFAKSPAPPGIGHHSAVVPPQPATNGHQQQRCRLFRSGGRRSCSCEFQQQRDGKTFALVRTVQFQAGPSLCQLKNRCRRHPSCITRWLFSPNFLLSSSSSFSSLLLYVFPLPFISEI